MNTKWSYVESHANDIKRAKELYAKYREVTYRKGWVEINGECINGISREWMEKIICELGM